ncbi:formate dehydrogenase accessory sulfurtransferase FdhD [Meiothermus ruber]|uniref:Sulfur carrier protein FdhD n=1 Tax=Meiothermus ruber (strain ATCC 35948 / DSM 1279 / VKM B-1258 / 21) TaxID=504728 RepID=D3PT88_MEIRD|nr:formate dehydrogenase accessory sulfurtransferase FdhD [Meiothermus ruber]ADD28671.1 formate dehydrogenase family accessory protein FdhD [Meiothermus ruber DSM 1279]AGK05884.1 formate dehydrogenase family accessory protein FdhD [Meiothermus ruber DSM 1279]MCL6531003.1 formate dehydrogenase accessory sulfurtransferase FdhD [Meiothermus ruber]MCX7801806.1 formate dehydrogenase accessory sulfurtransferase FdhD [Meiothermus ruber]GAO75632.1 formate dehydrogenase family accessory protein FdhD [M
MSISTPNHRPKARIRTRLLRIEQGQASARFDLVATEEPLEIRLLAAQTHGKTVAITMRTPGHDFELAAGFLLSEGLVRRREEIRRIAYCTDPSEPQQYNIVNVELNAATLPDLAPLERHFYTNSACGVCGKASLENLQRRYAPLDSSGRVSSQVITQLPKQLRAQQTLFAQTGGLHAAALFDRAGHLLALREDVGRHNALDKLLGWALLENRLPLSEQMVLVSGRASYELVQKALAAGVPVLCAISAPSSLAVELAQAFNLTLIGFLRDSFNVYSGAERLALDAS